MNGFRRRIMLELRRRRKSSHYAWLRLARRTERAGSGVAAVLSAATAVAAVAALVCAALYAGFESSSVNHLLLGRIIRACRFVFAAGIIFNLVFRFRRTMRDNRIIKWIMDAAVLLTLLPGLPLPRLLTFGIICVYAVVELSFAIMRTLSRRTNPSLILASSFLFFILTGALVLMLPRCTTAGGISFADSLFVATSAVSITGLTTVDVPATFTPMGTAVLALLVQAGGLGVLTFTSFFAIFFSGRPTIYHQLLIRDFIYSRSMSALVPVLLYILAFTLTVEAIGAVAIYFTLPAGMFADGGERMAAAAFHSLSAFCNAGFSTIPDGMANPALMGGSQNIYLVMSLLIFAGGIGFPNLVNIKDVVVRHFRSLLLRLSGRGRRIPRRAHLFDLNTKLVLATTVLLFVGGAVAFFVLESGNSMAGMPLRTRLIQSVFNAATPRSAGFTSLNPAGFLNVTLVVVMVQMAIGGASQSMAGGIKVNTFATALLSLRATLTGRRNVSVLHRNIAAPSVRRAHAVIVLSLLSLGALFTAELLLEPSLPPRALFFECVSALFTVGSSLGVTAELSTASKILLSAAMFAGRVGILSLLCGLAGSRPDTSVHYPADDIIIN